MEGLLQVDDLRGRGDGELSLLKLGPKSSFVCFEIRKITYCSDGLM